MIKRKSRFFLDRALRQFIYQGIVVYLGINTEEEDSVLFYPDKVIMANDSIKSPDDLFVTLQYIGESRTNPSRFEQQEFSSKKKKSFLSQAIHARYLVCFYRNIKTDNEVITSYDAAQAFVDFVDSQEGIAWASNAVIDGRLNKVYVYQRNGEQMADVHFDPAGFNGSDIAEHEVDKETDVTVPVEDEEQQSVAAQFRLYVSSNGKIESGYILRSGYGYSNGVEINLEDYPSVVDARLSGDVFPRVAVAGRGFTVDRPLVIEEEDYPLTENKMERRSFVELDINFIEVREERSPGTIQRYEFNVEEQS